MILAIDTGNTHTVIGCINPGGEIVQIVRMETNLHKTENEYAANMKLILEMGGVDLHSIEGAVISTVVPPLTPVLKKAVKLVANVDALIVGAGVRTGLPIMIDDPGTIAPDLVATAVAAKESMSLPCIIIDMGTATTVTVLDQSGRYIGGAILPGVGISMNALTQGTSLLPNIEIIPPNKVIATNTVECMKAGIIFGSAGAIDGVLDRFTESLQAAGEDEWSIVATGGLANTICPYCRHKITLDPDLLLKGLYIIWDKNRGSKRRGR
ncbi:MAG: type III pantothenate kinase [Eubacteriales bacterium]|nr:type III pantothenate kinase [Eubacteriales bacterium]